MQRTTSNRIMWATAHRATDPLAVWTGEGDVGPQASPGGTNGSAGGNAPPWRGAPLGHLAGRSTSQGDDDLSGVSPNNIDGDVADPDAGGASGD